MQSVPGTVWRSAKESFCCAPIPRAGSGQHVRGQATSTLKDRMNSPPPMWLTLLHYLEEILLGYLALANPVSHTLFGSILRVYLLYIALPNSSPALS